MTEFQGVFDGVKASFNRLKASFEIFGHRLSESEREGRLSEVKYRGFFYSVKDS